MFSCQIPACAEEVSYPLDMLAMWKDQPICEACYSEERTGEDPMYGDLPSISPTEIDVGAKHAVMPAVDPIRENERLKITLERARIFIEKEYRDHSAEEYGEWLSLDARPIHEEIIKALHPSQDKPITKNKPASPI